VGTSPWFGLAVGSLVTLWSVWTLRHGAERRRVPYVFLALGLLSVLLSLHELLPSG
jgi:hypothetical protein